MQSDRAAGEVAEPIFKTLTKGGRRYRALNPWSHKDGALLETISSAAWTINGFRNRDIRRTLFAPTKTSLGKNATQRVSVACSRCCAPTASSKRSPALTAIFSVHAADRS